MGVCIDVQAKHTHPRAYTHSYTHSYTHTHNHTHIYIHAHAYTRTCPIKASSQAVRDWKKRRLSCGKLCPPKRPNVPNAPE